MKLPSNLELALLPITVRESNGREIAQEYARRTGRELSYGSLYTTLRRMVESGWLTQRDDEDDDGRLRFYRITGAGRRALSTGIDARQDAIRIALSNEGF